MTTKTDITLPPLPQPRIMPQTPESKIAYGYSIDDMATYARAAVEADRREYLDTLKLARAIVNGHRRDNPPEDSVEADRQSQPDISDMQLHCILQVYDDALDKAREGREFDNPGRPGSLEARAWDAGTRRGKELGPINQPAASAEPRTYTSDDDFHANASTEELGAWQRGWNACRAQDAASAEPTESVGLLRHYGRIPDEVRAAYDKVWAIVFSSPVAAPVAQKPVAWVRMDEIQKLPFMLHARKERPQAIGNWVPVYAAPVAAQTQPAVNQQMTTESNAQDGSTLADTQRAIIEAAEQRGYARALAECGLDAERYRWLRNEAVSEPFGDDTKAPVVFNVDDCYQHDDADLLQGEALDVAIDAARAAREE